MCIVISIMKGVVLFHNFGFLIIKKQSVCIAILRNRRSSYGKVFWLRPPKSWKDEVSLLERAKPKSTRYKDEWAVGVFLNSGQAARHREKNFLYLSREVCTKIMMFTAC